MGRTMSEDQLIRVKKIESHARISEQRQKPDDAKKPTRGEVIAAAVKARGDDVANRANNDHCWCSQRLKTTATSVSPAIPTTASSSSISSVASVEAVQQQR